jgi:hypothetical protein
LGSGLFTAVDGAASALGDTDLNLIYGKAVSDLGATDADPG